MNGVKGWWIRCRGEWKAKAFAEQDVEDLRESGYKARLHSTTRPVKTPFGTVTGLRWFAQKFWPEEAADFRKGAYMKYKDPSNKSLDLDNLIPIDALTEGED